ncbi:MAG: PHP domain-containing protein [Planctomycetes bacterium]|nr:PHP domain-containing protein [Planctomycetota bacterium]
MTYCDLHMHSTASDGTDAPRHLARLASDAGLAGFALTDHDTTAGLPAAAAAAHQLRLAFVPGIELSADPDVRRTGASHGTLHILGYYIRHDDPTLQRIQRQLHDARAQRNPQMIDRLNELGVNIRYDEVLAEAGANQDDAAVVGRPHIAQVMVNKGYVKTIHEAFNQYIGMRGAAYIRKDRLKAAEAIDAIHAAGGVACFAHPVQLGLPDDDQLEQVVRQLKDAGLDGIETHHPDHRPADVARFQALARRYRLVTVGGSDYHGSRKTNALGSPRVPIDTLEQLHAARPAEAEP